jgi:hypothetical protein
MLQRFLSHDEKKAAEAAFQGRPCDPRWSSSAKLIYEGISKARLQSEAAVLPVLATSR